MGGGRSGGRVDYGQGSQSPPEKSLSLDLSSSPRSLGKGPGVRSTARVLSQGSPSSRGLDLFHDSRPVEKSLDSCLMRIKRRTCASSSLTVWSA